MTYTQPSSNLSSYSQPPLPFMQKTVPQQPLLGGVPLVGASEYHSREPGVVRSQLPFSVYDNRYWPYVPQPQCFSAPATSAPIQPLPAPKLLAVSERNFIPWQRHRRSRACESCHYRKVKCEGDDVKCNNCVKLNYECTWAPMRKRGPKPRPKFKPTASSAPLSQQCSAQLSADNALLDTYSLTPSNGVSHMDGPADGQEDSRGRGRLSSSDFSEPPNQSLDESLPEEIMRRFYSDEVSQDTRDTVVYYLDYFYGVCPIFHPATLVRRVVEGKVDPLLIQAMRASAARVITKHTGVYVDVDKAIEDVQQKLLLGLDNPSLDYVRAVVLLA
ncbi:hypothetical protein FBU31_006655, partial [Coemansia sp. 'formosensis']